MTSLKKGTKMFGPYCLSAGLLANPKKVQVIVDFPTPANKKNLMKFVNQFSQETASLRDLLKNDTSWV